MYSLKVMGQIEVIKTSEFEGKKTVKVQMVNITDKNIDVLRAACKFHHHKLVNL